MKRRIHYHGTSEAAWESIKAEGLRPHFEGVFLTPSRECADFYAALINTVRPRDGSTLGGGVVLQVDTTGLGRLDRVREPICDIQGWPDFEIYEEAIGPERITRL